MRYLEEVPTVAIRAPSFNAVWVKTLKNDLTREQFEAMTDKMPLRKHFYRQMTDAGFSPERIAESKERLRATLVRLSMAIDASGAYILGEGYTIADILLVPTVVRMDDLGLSDIWSDLPRVQEWYDRVRARPSFDIAYMPGARLDPHRYLEAARSRD